MNSDTYRAAIETHRFYDTISISIVGGMITLSGATIYLLDKIEHRLDKMGTIIVSVAVLLLLLRIYRFSAYYANVARNVAAKIEGDETNIGISTVLKKVRTDNNFAEYRADKKWYRGIYGSVHFLCIALVIGFITLAVRIC
ncbi:MAG: hypothetical protein WDZ52_10235 [Pseudohongiellaceae bacterium]